MFRFESLQIENGTQKDTKMNRNPLFLLPVTLLLLLTVSLFGGFKEGKRLFAVKCSSCHGGYIPEAQLKENFFKAKNRLLHLKAPTVNMLAYGLTKGPKNIGDSHDPEMRRIEIEEYLRDLLKGSGEVDRLLSPPIYRYFQSTHPTFKLEDEALANLAEYLKHYPEDRAATSGPIKQHFDGSFDLEKLQNEARHSGKILIVEASSPTCHYCKKMEREVLDDPDIRRMLRKDFILAEVNVRSAGLPKKLAKAYRHITPSFFFLSPEGKLLSSFPGSWTKSDFETILRENLRRLSRE